MQRLISTWFAIQDAVIRAAHQIRPELALAAMCITVVLCYCAMPFLMRLVDLLPMFRKRRMAEQNQALREERDHWKLKYADEAAARRELEEWKAAAEPLLAMEKSANRNFNARASQLVRR